MLVIGASLREWVQVVRGKKAPRVNEAPFVESRLASG
jgi:hypothetical protein